MLFSPLLNGSTRHPNADIVLVEGEIDGISSGERMLMAPYHVHHHDEEIFYVLSGQLAFSIDEREITASAGDAVLVPPEAVHTWWAASSQAVRYLIAMPKRLDSLVNSLHDGSYAPEDFTQAFEDYDSTLIGWSPEHDQLTAGGGS